MTANEVLQADYLVTGCGATAMAFADEDHLQVMAVTMRNQAAWNTLPALRGWIHTCRLDMFGQIMARVAKDDTPRREVLARLAAATGPAVENLQRS